MQAKKGPRPAPEHQQHRLVGLKKLERLTSQPLLFLRLGGQPQKLEKEAKASATRMFTTDNDTAHWKQKSKGVSFSASLRKKRYQLRNTEQQKKLYMKLAQGSVCKCELDLKAL